MLEFINQNLNKVDLHLRREAVKESQLFNKAFKGKSELGDSISWNSRLVCFGLGASLDLLYRIERVVLLVFNFAALTTVVVLRMPFAIILSPCLLSQQNKAISTFVKDSFNLLKAETKLAVENLAGFFISPMILATKNSVLALLSVEKNEQKKFEYLIMAANNGHVDSMVVLGEALLNGSYRSIVLSGRTEEGIKLLNQAIDDHSDKRAMIILGRFYNNPSTLDKSIDLYEKAVALDSDIARINLAVTLFQSNIDPVRARELYKVVADKGDTQAMIYYAQMLYNGEGGKQNIDEAKTLLAKAAAEPGEFQLLAKYDLANIKVNYDAYNSHNRMALLEGLKDDLTLCLDMEFIEISKEDVIDLLDRVCLEIDARNSDINAIKKLIALDNLPKDLLIEIYEIGAELGEESCLYNLGLTYLHADGKDEDLDKAVECFKKASDLDHLQARLQLAILMIEEIGSKETESEAIEILKELSTCSDLELAQKADSLLKHFEKKRKRSLFSFFG